MNIQCELCSSRDIDEAKHELPAFRHLDFNDVNHHGVYYACNQCGLLINEPNSVLPIIASILTESYSKSEQTSHTIMKNDQLQPLTRSYFQAQLLSKYLSPKDKLHILDIGCFDGSLLRELGALYQNAELFGYDINPHLDQAFPKSPRYHFYSNDLFQIEEKFDLIILSHSLIYIQPLKKLFEYINSRLKDNGFVFIQVPDLQQNPYAVLLADQYYWFEEATLKNLLLQQGFSFEKVVLSEFNRDIVFIAFKAKSLHELPVKGMGLNYYLNFLKQKKHQLLNLVDKDDQIAVLGTTQVAAFVDSVLEEKNFCFIDENPSKRNKTIRAKKIIFPEDLDNRIKLIIPYGKAGEKIALRLKQRYKIDSYVV